MDELAIYSAYSASSLGWSICKCGCDYVSMGIVRASGRAMSPCLVGDSPRITPTANKQKEIYYFERESSFGHRFECCVCSSGLYQPLINLCDGRLPTRQRNTEQDLSLSCFILCFPRHACACNTTMEWLFGKKKTPAEMLKENQRMLKRAMR